MHGSCCWDYFLRLNDYCLDFMQGSNFRVGLLSGYFIFNNFIFAKRISRICNSNLPCHCIPCFYELVACNLFFKGQMAICTCSIYFSWTFQCDFNFSHDIPFPLHVVWWVSIYRPSSIFMNFGISGEFRGLTPT